MVGLRNVPEIMTYYRNITVGSTDWLLGRAASRPAVFLVETVQERFYPITERNNIPSALEGRG